MSPENEFLYFPRLARARDRRTRRRSRCVEGGISTGMARERAKSVESRFPRLRCAPNPERGLRVEALEKDSRLKYRCTRRAYWEPGARQWRTGQESRQPILRRKDRSAACESPGMTSWHTKSMPECGTSFWAGEVPFHDKCRARNQGGPVRVALA